MKNGNIYELYGMLLEFEDGIMHRVVNEPLPVRGGIGNHIVAYMNNYVRTGTTFTQEEFNKLVKGE